MQDKGSEPTATDERIAQNLEPAVIAPATRDAAQSEPSGLPPGLTDDTRSPLDHGFAAPDVKPASDVASSDEPGESAIAR